ncbi:rCG25446, partial [Rattus norvegicus]
KALNTTLKRREEKRREEKRREKKRRRDWSHCLILECRGVLRFL